VLYTKKIQKTVDIYPLRYFYLGGLSPKKF